MIAKHKRLQVDGTTVDVLDQMIYLTSPLRNLRLPASKHARALAVQPRLNTIDSSSGTLYNSKVRILLAWHCPSL